MERMAPIFEERKREARVRREEKERLVKLEAERLVEEVKEGDS